MIDLLEGKGKSIQLLFLNNKIIGDRLIADAGYLAMGINKKEWDLTNELGELVVKICLPDIALKLPKDIFISLKEDPFEIIKIYKRNKTNKTK